MQGPLTCRLLLPSRPPVSFLVQNTWHPCQLSQHTATGRKKRPSRHTSLYGLPQCPGCWALRLANSGRAGVSYLEAGCSEASLGRCSLRERSSDSPLRVRLNWEGEGQRPCLPSANKMDLGVQIPTWDGGRIPVGLRSPGSKIPNQPGPRAGVSVFPSAQMATRMSL